MGNILYNPLDNSFETPLKPQNLYQLLKKRKQEIEDLHLSKIRRHNRKSNLMKWNYILNKEYKNLEDVQLYIYDEIMNHDDKKFNDIMVIVYNNQETIEKTVEFCEEFKMFLK